jgi:hypothetical protein
MIYTYTVTEHASGLVHALFIDNRHPKTKIRVINSTKHVQLYCIVKKM